MVNKTSTNVFTDVYSLPASNDDPTQLDIVMSTKSPETAFNATGISNIPVFDVVAGFQGNENSKYRYIAAFAAVNVSEVYDDPVVMRCQFQWCLQTQGGTTYNATADQVSGPVVKSISTVPLRRYLPDELHVMTAIGLDYVHYTSQPESASTDSIDQSNTFVMDAKGEQNLARQLADFFNVAVVGQTYDYSQKHFADGIAAYLKFQNVSEVADRLSTSLTNAIRGKENVIPMAVQGTGYTEEPYTHVRWGWVIPSALIIILSDLLVLLVIVQSHSKSAIFKSSVLAYIFHGYDGCEDNLRIHSPENPDRLYKAAENIRVRLERNINGDLRLREVTI